MRLVIEAQQEAEQLADVCINKLFKLTQYKIFWALNFGVALSRLTVNQKLLKILI